VCDSLGGIPLLLTSSFHNSSAPWVRFLINSLNILYNQAGRLKIILGQLLRKLELFGMCDSW
jgi:hypothetical protein